MKSRKNVEKYRSVYQYFSQWTCLPIPLLFLCTLGQTAGEAGSRISGYTGLYNDSQLIGLPSINILKHINSQQTPFILDLGKNRHIQLFLINRRVAMNNICKMTHKWKWKHQQSVIITIQMLTWKKLKISW